MIDFEGKIKWGSRVNEGSLMLENVMGCGGYGGGGALVRPSAGAVEGTERGRTNSLFGGADGHFRGAGLRVLVSAEGIRWRGCEAPGVILKYNWRMTAMHTTNLRKVGGSIMLAVPPALLDMLGLRPGDKVGIAVESDRLVVEPQKRRRYTLDELLAQCNVKAARGKGDAEWVGGKRVGGELI